MPGCPSGLARANTVGARGCAEDARALEEQVVPQPREVALGNRPRPANGERGAGRRAAGGRRSWTEDPELHTLNDGSPVQLVQ